MTVALVVTSAKTAELFVLGFANYLPQQGHSVHVITNDALSLEDIVTHPAIKLHSVAMQRQPSVCDLRALANMFRTIQALRPDVLAYATPKASLLASIAGCLARVPVRIYQLWGLRLETVRGPGRLFLAAAERLTSWLSSSILANSSSLSFVYKGLKLNCGRPVSVIGAGSSHGVDLNYFSREAKFGPMDVNSVKHLADGEGIVVGFIGRLHPDKGVDTLVEAARLLEEGGQNISVLLVGADEGAPCTLRPSTSVHLVGHVDDTRPYLRAMDVLVLMSRREGFPNVVLEAAAMGVPSIVSNATGVVDSVVNGVTGTIVPVDDADALARAINRLAEDREMRERMGLAARQRVEDAYDQKRVWESYEQYLVGLSHEAQNAAAPMAGKTGCV